MTLHQAAQKAVEALSDILGVEVMAPEGGREEVQEIHCIARVALASLESALQQQPEPVAEPPWWGASLNRRATVEQWMFDAARGKRPMPTPDELRARAIKLGTPAEGEPALQEVPREPVADFATWPDVRNRGLLQSAKQALAALDRQALLPWGTPGYPTHSPTADLVGEARSYLKPAIDREEAFRVGAMGEDPMVSHGGFPAPVAASPSTTQQQEAGSEYKFAGGFIQNRNANGSTRWEQVSKQYENDADVVKLYRLAAAPSTPENAGVVPDGVKTADGGQQ